MTQSTESAALAPVLVHAGDPLVGRVLLGRWRVSRPLHRGAAGAVYRGVQEGLGRAVAIKVVPLVCAAGSAARERLAREAQALAVLDHPALPPLLDHGVDGDTLVLVQPLSRGVSLARRLRQGPLEPAVALAVAQQLLSLLERAHAEGFVHGDLHPGHLLLEDEARGRPRLRVLGFGLRPPRSDWRADADALPLPAGLHEVAPEVIRHGLVDGRADLYAVGALLYRMLTGRPLFAGRAPAAVLLAHLSALPPRVGEARPLLAPPPALEWVLRTALEKDAAARFADARAFGQALEAVAEAWQDPARFGRRLRLVAGRPAILPDDAPDPDAPTRVAEARPTAVWVDPQAQTAARPRPAAPAGPAIVPAAPVRARAPLPAPGAALRARAGLVLGGLGAVLGAGLGALWFGAGGPAGAPIPPAPAATARAEAEVASVAPAAAAPEPPAESAVSPDERGAPTRATGAPPAPNVVRGAAPSPRPVRPAPPSAALEPVPAVWGGTGG